MNKKIKHRPRIIQTGKEKGEMNDLELFFFAVQSIIQERIKDGKKGIKVNQGTKISYHKLQGILFDLNCYFGLKGCFTFGICGTCNKFNNSKYSDGKIGDCKSQRKFWCDSCDQYAEVGFWKI